MKKILLCVFILLVSVNVCLGLDIDQLTEVANNGDAEAQYQLGEAYAFGNDVPHDFKQTAYWYQRAAEQEHATAQFRLGLDYALSCDVSQNSEQAFYWLQKAAEQRHADAQYFLGLCYEEGVGAPQNFKLAYMWMSLSLEHTTVAELQTLRREILEDFELSMTEAEIVEAEQMAAEWMEKHK